MTFLSNLLCHQYFHTAYTDVSISSVAAFFFVATILEFIDQATKGSRSRYAWDSVYIVLLYMDETTDISLSTLLLNTAFTILVDILRKTINVAHVNSQVQ